MTALVSDPGLTARLSEKPAERRNVAPGAQGGRWVDIRGRGVDADIYEGMQLQRKWTG
jgi:hypothetical protein